MKSNGSESRGTSPDKAKQLLLLWSAWHLVVWTFLPLVCNTCLPPDSIEAVQWGSEWQWGYDKHPPLSGWMAELFSERMGDAGVYFLSQLCVVLAGWGIYRVGLLLKLDEIQAVLAVLLLECIYFYTYSSVEFNVNILQLPFWAWGWYFGIHALKEGKLQSWVGLGICVGLGALTKYTAVFLLVPLFAYWWRRRQIFRVLGKPGLWLAGLVSVLFFTNHLGWLMNNDWASVSYGLERTGSEASLWLDHFLHPLQFALINAGILLPLVGLAWFARRQQKGIRVNVPRGSLTLFISAYLFWAVISLFTGIAPGIMWAAPLPLAAGIWMVPRFSLRRFRRYAYTVIIFMGLVSVAAYIILHGFGPRISEKPKRVNYPGPAIAGGVESAWEAAYSTDLKYVVADEWLGGIVNHYGEDEATVMPRASLRRSTYLSDEKVSAAGGVVLWLKSDDASDKIMLSLESVFPELRERFPRVEEQSDLVIPWPRRVDGKEGRYGLAFIPAEQ